MEVRYRADTTIATLVVLIARCVCEAIDAIFRNTYTQSTWCVQRIVKYRVIDILATKNTTKCEKYYSLMFKSGICISGKVVFILKCIYGFYIHVLHSCIIYPIGSTSWWGFILNYGFAQTESQSVQQDGVGVPPIVVAHHGMSLG